MTHPSTHIKGVGLVLTSSLGFAAMALWAKDSYAHGWSPQALVAMRFVLVAIAFWAIVAMRGGLRMRPPRRAIVAGLALGMTCYALENHLYFGAVQHLDAGLVALILSIYPALVVAGSVALGREKAEARKIGALTLSLFGAVLVLSGGARGGLDMTGVLMALGSAGAYASYLLFGDRLLAALDPFLLAALATTGAAISLMGGALISGDLAIPAGGPAMFDLGGLVLFSSIIPLAALWMGVQRIGASTASIVGAIEPAVTVTLAAVLLGEHLRDLQLVGGALVVSAVVLINARRSGSVARDEPALESYGVPAARALAHEPS